MLSKLLRKTKTASGVQLSLVLQPNSVSVAIAGGDVKFTKQLPIKGNDYLSAINTLAREVSFADAQCQIVLAHGLYQTVQVDNPNVPETEMRQALGWSAKDLFTIKSDDQLIDYYENFSNNPTMNKLNVVACDKSVIAPVVALLHSLSVNIQGISVEDVVISQLLNQNRANVLIFHVPGAQVLIAIIEDGKLCFSRRIHGYDNLHQMSEVDFSSGMLNNLGLEVQRSIDYALGQLRLQSIDNIYVAVQNFDIEQMLASFRELFDVPVQPLNLDKDGDFHKFPVNVAALAELKLFEVEA